MFRWLNKQGVASDRGFVVQCIDRFLVEYRQGGRIITVEFEPGVDDAGRLCRLISPRAFEHWDDSPYETLPLAEQQALHRNFRDAMEFQGVIVLQAPP